MGYGVLNMIIAVVDALNYFGWRVCVCLLFMLMMYAEISVKIRTYSQILFIAFEFFSFSKFVFDHIVFD